MNLLYIISSLDTGGAERLIGDLLPILNSSVDIQIKIIVFKKVDSQIERNLINGGIDIISLNSSKYSPINVIRLRNYIKNSDIVHVHLFPSLYFTAIANIGINKPLVYTEHSTHNRRRNYKLLKPFEKFIYNRYKKIIAISEATQDTLIRWLNIKNRSSWISIIENGINIKNYQNCKNDIFEKIFGRKGKAILMISRFTESKDQATLVRALNYIEDKECFIVFAGDGTKRIEIENLVSEYGFNGRVIFLGTSDKIPELIKASFIGVQSSKWEGFGLTAIEMMAGGIPVIASDVEGLEKIVKGAGLLFEKGNERMLANQINQIINNSNIYSELVTKGRNRAYEFSIEKTAKGYLDIYKGLLIK